LFRDSIRRRRKRAVAAVKALAGYLHGPGRAVLVLSLTQILGWGALVYSPVLILPHLGVERGWSLAFCMAGFSLALVTSGLVAPRLCGLIDKCGGHVVMAPGALVGAAGLAALSVASHPIVYLACWLLIGVAMSTTLYDAAFTSLGRIFGAGARREIIFVTFAGGFASTVGWPAVHLLIEWLGWRATYLVLAAVFACVIAPLHAFALPRGTAAPALSAKGIEAVRPMAAKASPMGKIFVLMAAGFALHAFVLSGMIANLLVMLERGGIDPTTVVIIGALFGPSQVVARMADFVFANRTDPLWVARAAIVMMLCAFALMTAAGISVPAAALFSVLFGGANGIVTIARGTLPLHIFGPAGYGHVLGRIARPAALLQAFAPFAFATAIDILPMRAVFAMGLACVVVSLVCFLAIRKS
jgi:MFS family permease